MLTLICGFPRAGKTTYSQQFEETCQVLHYDSIGSYDQIIQQVQYSSGDIVVDGIYYNRNERIRLANAYHGDKKQCIYLNTDEQIRKQRSNNQHFFTGFFPIPDYNEGWDEIIVITNNHSKQIIEQPTYDALQVIQFIRRFPDADWLTGNCYYFAVLLKHRFPTGQIYYDVIQGHFIFKLNDIFYDWTGIVNPEKPVLWDTFQTQYDYLQYEKILKNCIL